jgi:DNA helicase-2/ATP-dependent DNA helicase PcrA
MQAIFGWQGNERPDWDKHVCQHFRIVGELTTPWRWKNAGTENFGRWLFDVRRKLKEGTSVNLTSAPPEVTWVRLDGTEDRILQIRAGSIRAPTPDGTVLIVGKSTSPSSQQEFASQIPGAETVEAVELKDMVQFARDLDFQGVDALEKVASFAGSVMANVGAPDLIQRVGILERGKGRREPSDAERAALRFKATRTPSAAVDLLVEISKTAGVKKHRPSMLRASIKALRSCDGSEGNTFLDAAIRAREQNRLLGRPLPKRAVGSTLTLKGLEADVSVILDAGDLDARNLYVAMTRGSRRLLVCSDTAILTRQPA